MSNSTTYRELPTPHQAPRKTGVVKPSWRRSRLNWVCRDLSQLSDGEAAAKRTLQVGGHESRGMGPGGAVRLECGGGGRSGGRRELAVVAHARCPRRSCCPSSPSQRLPQCPPHAPCFLSPHGKPQGNPRCPTVGPDLKRPLELSNDSEDLGASSRIFTPHPPSSHYDPQGPPLLDERGLDKGGGFFPPRSPHSHPRGGGCPPSMLHGGAVLPPVDPQMDDGSPGPYPATAAAEIIYNREP